MEEQGTLVVTLTKATSRSDASVRAFGNRDRNLGVYEGFPPRGDNLLLCAEPCVSRKPMLKFDASMPNLYRSYPAARSEPRVGSRAFSECLLILSSSTGAGAARRFEDVSEPTSESECFLFKVFGSEVIWGCDRRKRSGSSAAAL